jgi:hypothetical protein
MSSREIDIAQDNFPEIGSFDFVTPENNHVRFDMARNISLQSHLQIDPGDSIVFDVVAVRTNSVLNDRPKMYYKLFPNPVFDPYRSFPNQGWVYGDTTRNNQGVLVEDRYNFDLPDTGFMYPGDVLNYYIEGTDNQGGNIGTTLIPADTSGFEAAPGYPNYIGGDFRFQVQALPTFSALAAGAHPKVLFWNDFANRGGERMALRLPEPWLSARCGL